MDKTYKALIMIVYRQRLKKRRTRSSEKPARPVRKAPRRLSAFSRLWQYKHYDPAWEKTRWGYVVMFTLVGFGVGALAFDLATRPYELMRHLSAGQLLTALVFGAAGALTGWIVGRRKRYHTERQMQRNQEEH